LSGGISTAWTKMRLEKNTNLLSDAYNNSVEIMLDSVSQISRKPLSSHTGAEIE
jgi:hypothetical protein